MIGRIRQALSYGLSFEMLFVLYLFAGRYKADPRLDWVPVDLTAVFLLCSLVGGVFVLLRSPHVTISRSAGRFLIVSIIFIGWIALSYFWTSSPQYGGQKAFYMGSLVLWAIVAPLIIIGPSSVRTSRFLTLLVAFAIGTALEGARVFMVEGGGFLRAFGANYLALGTTLGAASAILIGRYLSGEARALWVVPLFLAFGAVMLIGGGRGPVVALAVVLLVLSIFRVGDSSFRIRSHLKRRRVHVLLSLGVAGIALSAATVDHTLLTVSRFETLLFDESGGTSGAARLEHYQRAIGVWAQYPVVGAGVGGYATEAQDIDFRAYPHNIILEILSETGVIGFLLFFLLMISGLGRVITDKLARGHSSSYAVFALSIYFLMFAQFSGDMSDNRYAFMALGLLAAVSSRNTRSSALEVRRLASQRVSCH